MVCNVADAAPALLRPTITASPSPSCQRAEDLGWQLSRHLGGRHVGVRTRAAYGSSRVPGEQGSRSTHEISRQLARLGHRRVGKSRFGLPDAVLSARGRGVGDIYSGYARVAGSRRWTVVAVALTSEQKS